MTHVPRQIASQCAFKIVVEGVSQGFLSQMLEVADGVSRDFLRGVENGELIRAGGRR
jgi:hypothetical protein